MAVTFTYNNANYAYGNPPEAAGQEVEFKGLHTDSKPLDVAVNSLFLELDTGDFYYFNGTTWAKVGA